MTLWSLASPHGVAKGWPGAASPGCWRLVPCSPEVLGRPRAGATVAQTAILLAPVLPEVPEP